MMTTILIVCIAVIAFCAILGIRNNRVYTSQMDRLAKVSAAARNDIWARREWEWRYESLDSVSYSEMVLKFWKPLDSFYPKDGFDNANVFVPGEQR